MRTVLIHLNAELPDDDPRNADEVADSLLADLERARGLEPGAYASGAGGALCCTLAEDV